MSPDPRYQWKDLEKDEEFIRLFVSAISASPSENFLWSSFRLATKAWSTHDVDDRLAQLWTAFEVLFSRSMSKNDPFEKIIQRASFLSKDRRYARLVLKQAAQSRNNYLHRRETVPAVEQLSDWLQSFYAGVIEWVAFSRMGFESHGRFLDMTELSNDEQALTDQIADRERALKVMREG